MASKISFRRYCSAALALGIAASTAPLNAETGLNVELNKLEAVEGACRAYMLFENTSASAFSSLKLDLVLFGNDGVIIKRLAVEGAPLPQGKTSVKLFEISGLTCAEIGRVLLNDVISCRDDSGDRDDCVASITTSSRGAVTFFK